MDDSRLETEAQVLLEPDMEVGLALRREHVVERPHLGLVVGSGPDLPRAAEAQLAVGGVAVALGGELRLHADGVVLVRGLAAVPSRGARAGWHVREADAAILAALGEDRPGPRVGRPQPGGEDRVRDEAQ